MVESFYNEQGEMESGSMMDSHFSGKAKHAGAGGNKSKSHNFKECKNANIRRNAKFERERAKEEAAIQNKYVA